ncbi:MAG: hypothetical protein NTZ30_09140 [Planctomycetota bacterium]|nr:hypothetical protein [Planctomycetota bacterium]
MHSFLYGFACWLFYLGLEGWIINRVPTQYFGYLLALFGVAGLFGVNIWNGGPLDPHNDPPLPSDSDDQSPQA